MSKFETLYSIKWEEWFAWLRKACDSALCTICNKVFRIDEGGLPQVRSHQKLKNSFASSYDDSERFSIPTEKIRKPQISYLHALILVHVKWFCTHACARKIMCA